MGRKLILGLVIVITLAILMPVASCQQGNTVFAKIISAATTDPTATVVPSKYMVGQPYHMATAIFSDRPTLTCSTVIDPISFSIPVLSVFGSYDNVIYTDITLYTRPINPGSGGATDRYRMMTSASGAFPFIKLSIGNWNQANCKVDVFYSGTIQALDIKKYVAAGTTSDPLQSFTFAISGAATTNVITAIPDGRIVIYAITFTNSAVNNVTFQEVRTDAGTVNLLILNGLVAGAIFNSPNTNFPMYSTSPGSSLNIITSGAGTLSGSIVFRVE